MASIWKKYNYELIDYQAGLQEEVLSFLHRYTNEGGADDDLPAICYALDHLKELSLFADLLYANQTLVAISIGGISKRNYGVVLLKRPIITILVRLSPSPNFHTRKDIKI